MLRQYDEADVIPAWQTMGRALLPGGLLIEGTSDPYGRVLTANLLRRVGDHLRYEGLLFSTNFRWGFAPGIFSPCCPRTVFTAWCPAKRSTR